MLSGFGLLKMGTICLSILVFLHHIIINNMKVKELIQELQKYDPEMECVAFDDHDGCAPDTSAIQGVSLIKIDGWGNIVPNADPGKEVLYFSVY